MLTAGVYLGVLSIFYGLQLLKANLLESSTSFKKFSKGCGLLGDKGTVVINYDPTLLLLEMTRLKDDISPYIGKKSTGKVDNAIAATFEPVNFKLDELIEKQHFLINSFDKLSTDNIQKRAISKAAIFGLISKTLIRATKKTLVSTVQQTLADTLGDGIQSPQIEFDGIKSTKSIVNLLKNQISMGRHREDNGKKLVKTTLDFFKELTKWQGGAQTKMLQAIQAQNEQLSFLNHLKEQELPKHLAWKLNIPSKIENIKIQKNNNTYAVTFDHYKRDTILDTYKIESSPFLLDTETMEFNLPESIAIIDNETYINDPFTSCGKECKCTPETVVLKIDGCLKQIISAKQGLEYDVKQCAQHVVPSKKTLSIINYKNNLFTIFSKMAQNITIRCANVPVKGRINVGINVVSIPNNCSLEAEKFRVTNAKYSMTLATPDFADVKRDLRMLEQKRGEQTFKYDVEIHDMILSVTQAILWVTLLFIVAYIKHKNNIAGNSSRVLTPLPELDPPNSVQ